MAQSMNLSESIAQRFFQAFLPGSHMNYNPVQSNGEHDFNLLLSDGTIAALEITSCVDAVTASTIAEIYRKNRGGSLVAVSKCKRSWFAFIAPGVSVPKIRTHIDEYLSRLESAGVDGFSFFDGLKNPCVRDLSQELGVVMAHAVDNEPTPRIEISLTAHGGAVGASTAAEVGEHLAQKLDNRRKLAAADAEERALVVYIDPRSGLPWIALTDFHPPATPANLPSEVTSLWLIGPTGRRDDEFVGWYGCANQAWQSCTVICR